MKMHVSSEEEAKRIYNKNIVDITYDLMSLFQGHMANYRIQGFFFPESDQNMGDNNLHIPLRVKCLFFQIAELSKMDEAVGKILESYCGEEWICAQLYVDNEGVYVEVLIDNFS